MSEVIIIATLLLPLLGGIVAATTKQQSGWILAMLLTLTLGLNLVTFLNLGDALVVEWFWLTDVRLRFEYTQVSGALLMLVLLIATLVTIYSIAYMKEEPRKHHYFGFLGFFVFAMCGLLMAQHLILTFIFWELVGFASYLLIGFWYKKESVATSARQAFMVNRFADGLLLAGILWVLGSRTTEAWAFVPSLLIVLGAIGKSAQLPYSGWLTKAMVGPTPVSALIHAATMVAAGVYVTYTLSPQLHPAVLEVTAYIGGFTAFYGAVCALTQFDIKRILAYSTISQLGYMVLAVGVGARGFAIFHLWTHAFFKSGLFLGAASIIHYMAHHRNGDDPQDIRNMGGLRKEQPTLFYLFFIFSLALMGIPLFAGFLSKEGILAATTDHYLLSFLGFATVALTAFYVVRMLLYVFDGESVKNKGNESVLTNGVLSVLATGSIWIGYSLNPFSHDFLLVDLFGGSDAHASIFVTLGSFLLVGIGGGYSYFKFKHMDRSKSYLTSRIAAVSYNGFYLNHLYELIAKGAYWLALLYRRGLKLNPASAISYSKSRFKIDTVLHGIGLATVLFAKMLALVDRFIIDGVVNTLAIGSGFVGSYLARINARKAQIQLIWMAIFLILVLAFLFLF